MCPPHRTIRVALALAFSALSACQARRDAAAPERPSGPTPYLVRYPLGLQAESAVIPADNPMTVEKIRLGKRLFFDPILSLDDSISCASCHIPETAFADPRQFSDGVGGRKGDRNAPAVINRIFSGPQFWDGRAASLEEQALAPVQNPAEMAMPNLAFAIGKVQKDSAYLREFRNAFPGEQVITEKQVAQALASFERTILSGDSPYDRFMSGDKTALSAAAVRGMTIFRDKDKGNCETCHVSFNFTDENYNNIGVGISAANPDLGRYRISGLEGHQGAFKTPTLREVANTAPYMHDGSQRTLEEVIQFYEEGGHPNRWLSPKIKRFKLSRQERQDLVEFLRALSGDVTWYGK